MRPFSPHSPRRDVTPAHGGCRLRRRCRHGAVLAAVVVGLGLVGCTTGDPAGEVSDGGDQRSIDAANDAAAGAGAGVCVPPECGTTVPYLPADGYVGPAPGVTDEAAAVDGASVVAATEGEWWAQGLVVNGPDELRDAPIVVADLVGPGGRVLRTVTTTALVAPLRAGEPAPFRLDAPGVDAAEVVDVAWQVRPGTSGPDGDTAPRTLQIDTLWTRPAGGQAVSVPSYADDGGPGTPLVTYLSITNTGALPVAGPRVTAAWVDGRGRVLGLTSVSVPGPGTNLPLAVMAPGGQADVALTLAPPAADGLASVQPLLWGMSGP